MFAIFGFCQYIGIAFKKTEHSITFSWLGRGGDIEVNILNSSCIEKSRVIY
jgi:hypothetical protein